MEIYIDSFELADVIAVRELLRFHIAPWVPEVRAAATETEGRMAATETEGLMAAKEIKDRTDVRGRGKNTGVKRVLAVSMAE